MYCRVSKRSRVALLQFCLLLLAPAAAAAAAAGAVGDWQIMRKEEIKRSRIDRTETKRAT